VKFHSILIAAALGLPLAAQTPPPKAAAPAPAPAGVPTKIAIIQFQQAVLTSQEGQAASATLKTKYDPRKSALEKKQADLEAMQDKLQKGGPTMTADARAKIQADIAAGTRILNRDAQDLNTEVQEEEARIMQGMAGKMGEIIKNYATQNGYAIVLDVSSEATPVLWATPASNITADIVKLYDQTHPAKAAAPPSSAKKQ
jgi:outer membrane protein